MMIKREVLVDLNGYDPELAYEDFDFWIRSSRKFLYLYNDENLVSKRIHKNNYSKKQFTFRSKQMHSTYKVCRKIYQLNQSKDEHKALQKRVFYEFKKSIQYFNMKLAFNYFYLGMINAIKV